MVGSSDENDRVSECMDVAGAACRPSMSEYDALSETAAFYGE